MDQLLIAATFVQRRAARTRALAAVVLILVGLALGAVAYAALRQLFLERYGVSSPIAVATLTALPILALAFASARAAGAWVVAARRPAWVEHAARTYAVDRDELEELTRL